MLDESPPTMPDMATEWTWQEEGARLRARFNAEGAPKQAAFARLTGWPGGPNMLNQVVQSKRPMTLEMATCAAKGFGVALAAISPRWDRVVRAALEIGGAQHYSELSRESLYIAGEFNRIKDATRQAELFREIVMLIQEALPGGQRPAPSPEQAGRPNPAPAESPRKSLG